MNSDQDDNVRSSQTMRDEVAMRVFASLLGRTEFDLEHAFMAADAYITVRKNFT